MPVFFHQDLPDSPGELGLWRIVESEAWFLSQLQLQPHEQDQLDRIKGHRRVEWLSVRLLVHQMSGRSRRGTFLKDEYGKPHLLDSPWEVSVSHSRELSAAIAAPRPVGIDIQRLVPKIERLVPRFMRPEEQQSLSSEQRILHAHVYWGAKEALYKAYGRKELDFCYHIRITPFHLQGTKGQCRGWVEKGGFYAQYEIRYELLADDYMLVYCLEGG